MKTKPTIRSNRTIGSPLLPPGSAGAVTEWFPTRWPRVGGKTLLPLTEDAFTTKRFRAAYEAGKLVFIYVAGCGEDHRMPTVATGLLGLARRLRMPIHKVSVTAQVNLRDRLRELNADHYGALTTSADGYCCSDLGFDNWMAQHTQRQAQMMHDHLQSSRPARHRSQHIVAKPLRKDATTAQHGIAPEAPDHVHDGEQGVHDG